MTGKYETAQEMKMISCK